MSANNDGPMNIHERCQYPNKQCPNRRTTKTNGQMHRFCEEHKEKAKRNQQRWLDGRLERAKSKSKAADSTGACPASTPARTQEPGAPEDEASLDDLEKLLFDEHEMNEFLDALLVSHEELVDLQADVARAFQYLKQ